MLESEKCTPANDYCNKRTRKLNSANEVLIEERINKQEITRKLREGNQGKFKLVKQKYLLWLQMFAHRNKTLTT